ncbi:MAG: HAD hydrolase-like protein [Planctomycetota bacterium]|nr:HAD hydrolase-like protein [Planctomycetota bacterium]MDA1261603.1 HAD hydrolase-like protein [Planctomycetota bacterium]
MHLHKPAAILFDLDGTLVDSVGDIADAANEMLARLGLPTCPDVDIRHYVGNGVRLLVDRAIMRDIAGGAPNEQINVAIEIFREVYSRGCVARTTLMPHARETLQSLAAEGVILSVVTNKPENPTRQILDHFKLSELISSIIGGDTLAVRKPDPAVVRESFLRAGLDQSANAWLVGDSHTDVMTAKSAGIQSIVVRGGYNHGKPVEELDPPPDAIVGHLGEVLAMYRAARSI